MGAPVHYSKKSREAPANRNSLDYGQDIVRIQTLVKKNKSTSTEQGTPERRRKAKEVAQRVFSRHDTEEDSIPEVRKKKHKKKNKVTASTSSSGTGIESHREFVLPDKLPSETPLTELQQLKKKDFEKFQALQKSVNALVTPVLKNGVTTTDRDKQEMMRASHELTVAAAQNEYNLNDYNSKDYNLGGERPKKDTNIDFFCPNVKNDYPAADFVQFNGYLNETIGLSKTNSQRDLKKMLSLMSFDKDDAYRRSQNWQKTVNASLEAIQSQFSTLSKFTETLKYVCMKLRNVKFKVENVLFQSKQASLLLANIRKMIASQTNPIFKEALIEAIEVRYLQGHVENLRETKANEIIKCHVKNDPKAFMEYPDVVADLIKNFNTQLMPDQMIAWKRAIFGGIVEFVNSKSQTVLKPFVDPGEHRLVERDIALNEYVIGCQTVVGEHLFEDDAMLVELCRLIEEEAKLHMDSLPTDTYLDGQKKIQDYVSEKAKVPEEMGAFLQLITERLRLFGIQNEKIKKAFKNFSKDPEFELTFEEFKELKDQTPFKEYIDKINEKPLKEKVDRYLEKYPIGIMLMYLQKFYRAPSQTFVWGPWGTLVNILALLFPDNLHILGKLDELEDNETKKIYIRFNPHDLTIKFVRKGKILNPNNDSYYIFEQDLSIVSPLVGGTQPETVSVQFYYEVPDGVSAKDQLVLDEQVARISLALNAAKFPHLKKLTSQVATTA